MRKFVKALPFIVLLLNIMICGVFCSVAVADTDGPIYDSENPTRPSSHDSEERPRSSSALPESSSLGISSSQQPSSSLPRSSRPCWELCYDGKTMAPCGQCCRPWPCPAYNGMYTCDKCPQDDCIYPSSPRVSSSAIIRSSSVRLSSSKVLSSSILPATSSSKVPSSSFMPSSSNVLSSSIIPATSSSKVPSSSPMPSSSNVPSSSAVPKCDASDLTKCIRGCGFQKSDCETEFGGFGLQMICDAALSTCQQACADLQGKVKTGAEGECLYTGAVCHDSKTIQGYSPKEQCERYACASTGGGEQLAAFRARVSQFCESVDPQDRNDCADSLRFGCKEGCQKDCKPNFDFEPRCCVERNSSGRCTKFGSCECADERIAYCKQTNCKYTTIVSMCSGFNAKTDVPYNVRMGSRVFDDKCMAAVTESCNSGCEKDCEPEYKIPQCKDDPAFGQECIDKLCTDGEMKEACTYTVDTGTYTIRNATVSNPGGTKVPVIKTVVSEGCIARAKAACETSCKEECQPNYATPTCGMGDGLEESCKELQCPSESSFRTTCNNTLPLLKSYFYYLTSSWGASDICAKAAMANCHDSCNKNCQPNKEIGCPDEVKTACYKNRCETYKINEDPAAWECLVEKPQDVWNRECRKACDSCEYADPYTIGYKAERWPNLFVVNMKGGALPSGGKSLLEGINHCGCSVSKLGQQGVSGSKNQLQCSRGGAVLDCAADKNCTYYFDENCNRVNVSSTKNYCVSTLNALFESPISLIWEDTINLKFKPSTFPLDPRAAGKWNVWKASAKTPLLVYDPEKTGEITSAEQLFGNHTFGKTWKDGYEALASLDKNRDGKLSGEELKNLSLWFDKNQNGIAEKGEVVDIREAGVLELYYQKDPDNVMTTNIAASKGYLRKVGDTEEIGASVDWFSGQYETRGDAEAAIKRDGNTFKVQQTEQLQGNIFVQSAKKAAGMMEENVDTTKGSVSSDGLGGTWTWVTDEKSFVPTVKGEIPPGGTLALNVEGNKLTGQSVATRLLNPNSFGGKQMVMIFILDGEVQNTDGITRAVFRIDNEGSITETTVELSKDGKTLHGVTRTATGSLQPVHYTWTAVRSPDGMLQ